MIKRGLIVLVLAALVAGGVFAQKNTITVDLGPTIVGAAFGAVGKMIGEEGFNTSGFGIGAQYEFQPFEKVSFAGRFAYLGLGVGYTEKDNSGFEAKLNMDLNSFSIEGHARFYPFGETFFLDGMAGYGRLMANMSGQVIVEEYGVSKRESVSLSPARNYIKLGAKLGWRITFGRSGSGFTFEPSAGYYFGIGMGNTIGKQLADHIGNDIDEGDISGFDDAFGLLEKFILIGGPRVSLAFGWRF